MTAPIDSSGTSTTSSSTGSQRLAVDFLRDDVRARERELVPFAPHGLDQDRQMQLPAAGDAKGVRLAGVFDAQRDVGAELLVQPLLQVPARDVFPFGSGERGVVDAEASSRRSARRRR